MSQQDFDITATDANTGLAFRAAVNAALQALASCSSGGAVPTTPYPYQVWADTTNGLLKQRNGANTAWITIGSLDAANWGLLPLAGGTMTGDIVLKGDPTAALHPATKQYADARTPAGVLYPYAGAAAPAGFLLCDGSAISRTTYAGLFAVCGTTYGAGDGSTTFNLPDLRGMVPVGAGQGPGLTNRILGNRLGEENHILTVNELPAHNHGVTDPGHSHTATNQNVLGAANVSSGAGYGINPSNTGNSTTGIAIGNTGGGAGHNVMQPFVVLNYIIKY